jgi:hypothetical protein
MLLPSLVLAYMDRRADRLSTTSNSSSSSSSSAEETPNVQYIVGVAQWILAAIGLLVLVFAVYIALRCNPRQRFLRGLMAFLFPEVYLIQHGVRLARNGGYDENFCGCMAQAGCVLPEGNTDLPIPDLLGYGYDWGLPRPKQNLLRNPYDVSGPGLTVTGGAQQ